MKKSEIKKYIKNKVKGCLNVSHLYLNAHVIGYCAPKCVIVWRSYKESEPQVRKFVKEYPLQTVYDFDKDLKSGDSCMIAYISRKDSGTIHAFKHISETK